MPTSFQNFPFEEVVGHHYQRPAFGEQYEGTITDYSFEEDQLVIFYDGLYAVFEIDVSASSPPGATWSYNDAGIKISVPLTGKFNILGVSPPA